MLWWHQNLTTVTACVGLPLKTIQKFQIARRFDSLASCWSFSKPNSRVSKFKVLFGSRPGYLRLLEVSCGLTHSLRWAGVWQSRAFSVGASLLSLRIAPSLFSHQLRAEGFPFPPHLPVLISCFWVLWLCSVFSCNGGTTKFSINSTIYVFILLLFPFIVHCRVLHVFRWKGGV